MFVVRVNGKGVAADSVETLARLAIKAAEFGIDETDGLSFVRASEQKTEKDAIALYEWSRIAPARVNYEFQILLEKAGVI